MTGELPKGWAVAPLVDLVEIRDAERVPVNQNERDKRHGPVPYFGATGQVGWIDEALFDDDLVLLGEDGVQFFDPTRPKAYLISGPAWVNNHAHVLEALHVDRRYLKYFLDQADYQGLATGTTRLKLTQGAMKRMGVLLPPAAEQLRIVAELERRLSHVQSADASLDIAVRLLRSARSSVLRAITTGALLPSQGDSLRELCDQTSVGFDDDPRHEDLVWVRLGDVATVGSGTTPSRGNPSYWTGGDIPWVTSGQVTAGVIRQPAELVTKKALEETSLRLWPAGTLLLAMYGEGQTRGRCAELQIEASCNQACAAIALLPDFAGARPFVRLYLQAMYEENRRLGGGGVQENLNLGIVKDIRIPLPGLETQAVWTAEAERRLSLIESAERTVELSMLHSSQLRRSLLAAAFSGRLVTQDPDDESADILLERIRSERESAGRAKTRGARRTKNKEIVA